MVFLCLSPSPLMKYWYLHKKPFWDSETLVHGISKKMLVIKGIWPPNNHFFTCNNKFYIQMDGLAIGSPLGQILANVFLPHYWQNWLNKCPAVFKLIFIESMPIIFSYFLHHLNLPTRFDNMCLLCLLNTKN